MIETDTVSQIRDLVEMSYKVKMLIYGPPGVGKTIFAAHSPSPLILDADGTGALSLLNHPELAARSRVLQVRTFNQMLDVLEAYRRGDPRVAHHETIIVDTLSELAKRHLDQIVAKEKSINPNRDAVPFQRDYKFNTEGMRQLVIFFLELDVNLICLAHETEEKDEATNIFVHRPFLTPRLASTMEAVFDVFGFMTAETDQAFNVTRTLQIMPSRRVKAKTRIGGLPPLIADPIAQHFINAKAIMLDNAKRYVEEQSALMSPPQPPVAETTPEPIPEPEPAVEAAEAELVPEIKAPAFVGTTFQLDPETANQGASSQSEETNQQ